MTRRTRTMRFEDLPTEYDALVAMLAPRPIHDKVELHNVSEIVDVLAGHDLTDDQADYLDILSDAIEKYEAEQTPLKAGGVSAVHALRCLLEANEMTASDLGRLLGERSLGTKVLRGERELSKAHIAKLCDRFKVSADLFI